MLVQRSHPLRSYEIEGRGGEIISFPGTDFMGRDEFHQRLTELAGIIEATGTDPELLYETHRYFKWVCDRAITLNGIDTGHLNWELIEGLLFSENATLVLLNQPKAVQRAKVAQSAKAQTIAEIIAILSESQGGVEGAIALLTNYPADLVDEVLEAIANLHKTDEQKEKEKIQEWAEKRKTEGAGGRFKPGQVVQIPGLPIDETSSPNVEGVA